jgi:hypothetical protein
VPPEASPSPVKGAPREGFATSGGPLPPEGMQEPRPRRTKQAAKKAPSQQPPKIVRDFLRSLGFK